MIRLLSYYKLYLVLLLGIVFALINCGGGASGDLSQADSDTTAVNADRKSKDMSESIARIVLATPSPLLLANLLKSSGAKYEASLLNPINNLKRYQELEDKALNLGAYSADLSYASVFNKKKEALDYFNGVSRLAEDIGVGNIFNKQLKTRVDENQENRDSLEKIFADTFTHVHSELKKKNQEHILSLIFAGGWVEALYLATEIWKLKPNEQVALRIVEQKVTLEDILDMLNKSKPKPDYLIRELNMLQQHFDKIQTVQRQGKNQLDPETGIIKVGGSVTYKYDNSIIEAVRKKTEEIRNKIVLCQITST
jgi:hypothetical protein